MKGLIVINAYPNGEKFIRQAERIASELRLLGVEMEILRNGEVFSRVLSDGTTEIFSEKQYDFAVYLDKDKYLGEMLERSGLRLFNSARAVELCDDKMRTYLALLGAGVTLAESIPAPLCYTPNAKADEGFLDQVAEKLGYPLVVKKSYGSFGTGVALVRNRAELVATAQKCLYEPHFYQRYIAESAGKDIRVIVVGGKALAAMERVAKAGEFRSNIELGGRGKKIELSEEYAKTAERAASALGLDYCGVDLLETGKGAVVCEVNSNAFFEGLEQATGANVAAAYARYIKEKVEKTAGLAEKS
ncbi:MAG: RimK family alpha-L-glutamate ligase [Clostridia bacterium]|nr:RimK family alpha-L-glutamate ligase [Clostridia bacterium]